jgi:hypothetical protein
MSASEALMHEQLDRIIARTELRVEQWGFHASALARHGDEAKEARDQLALALTGLAKLKAGRNEFSKIAVAPFTQQLRPDSTLSAPAPGRS